MIGEIGGDAEERATAYITGDHQARCGIRCGIPDTRRQDDGATPEPW